MASHFSNRQVSSLYEKSLRRNRLRKILMETLERRELLASDFALAAFAAGTSLDYANDFESQLNGSNSGSGGDDSSNFNVGGRRWFNPVGGPSANAGDPAEVTWSIVPDGTTDTANNSSTNLVAFMDGIYGGGAGPVEQRPWFSIFQRAYDRWSEVSGLTFVYEPADDGAPMGGGNRGVAGVRGDVRIGGRPIDGNFGVLAFNYFPNNGGNSGFDGDMIIDTDDVWYLQNADDNGTDENRGLFNVLMHEAGHGIGLGHSIPVNETKLMEPFISLAYSGAQHDDILGAHALYGDNSEPDDTAGAATDLGQLGNGLIRVEGNSLDADNDQDWIEFSVPSSAKISVDLTPIGFSYEIGNQGGGTEQTDSSRYQDLSFRVFDAAGNELASVNDTGLGEAEALSDLDLPAAGTYRILVEGAGDRPQLYDLAMIVDGITSGEAKAPTLLSISPNVGEIFSFNRTNSLEEGPNELVFRFDSFLDASSFDGIRITRSGKDNDFTDGDEVTITPGWVGFGETDRNLIARFSEPLEDDLYRLEAFGVDIPGEGITAVRSSDNLPLAPRIDGTDRDTLFFDLELGAKVIAVVPQPTTSNPDGTVTQARNTIEVFFNDDDLHTSAVSTTGGASDPTVVRPEFYQLILSEDTVNPDDDTVFLPDSVSYDPATDKAILTFAQNIDELAGGDGTFRLRVGSNTEVNSAANPSSISSVAPADDPEGFLSGAVSLNTEFVGNSLSTIVSEELLNVQNHLLLDFPGSDFEPGHRDIQDQKHLGGLEDESQEITQAFYNFALDRSYGNDAFGQPLFTSITPEQIERVREIYEFYGAQLGIDFVESASSGMTVVVGDPFPNGAPGGPGGVLGVASLDNLEGLAIMDGAEAWRNDLTLIDGPNGQFSFFGTALHEIGHMLGVGHTYELPVGTIMGSTTALSSGGPHEEIFPGNHDITHAAHGYRPDNKDVDLYRIDIPAGVTGEIAIETVAERLADSSNADTHLTLFKQTANGLNVVATNNDYFSSDSYINIMLDEGTYFIGVTAFGNEDFDPVTDNTGSGGVSQGDYDLRVSFAPQVESTIVDINGTALDGDGDGIAGGEFNFWFRAATPVDSAAADAPKTVFVNKDYTGVQTGSESQPFSSIPAATAAVSTGDIIRITPSLGADGDLTTQDDNPAYEIGRGGVGNAALGDGISFEVPAGVTAMIDAGSIFKMGASRIVVGSRDAGRDNSFAALQVLGTPEQQVLFTSINDESVGIDTNPIPTTPQAGQWGGLEFRNDVDRSEGRGDHERNGVFLNYVGQTTIQYGGGQVLVSTPSPTISPIHLNQSRPTILENTITFSADSAISADPDSFEETLFSEPRYQIFGAFDSDYERVGPDLRGNALLSNSVNGIFVRAETLAGSEIDKLDVAARFDDTDITHVLGENLIIAGTPGGAFLEEVAPDTSLVTSADAEGTLTAGDEFAYIVTAIDLRGAEGLPSAPTALATVGADGGIFLDNLPAASGDFVGRRLYRSEPGGAGTFTLIAELDGDTPTFTDSGSDLGAELANQGATQLQRARLDARLAVDAGIIVKSQGARIEVGIGAQLIAEGTNERQIVFTSRADDRFGAGSNFDTNNDGDATTPSAGDWAGLIARHFSSISIDSALITHGGGTSPVAGGFSGFNAVEFHQADARIANSTLEENASGLGGNLGGIRDGRGNHDASVIFVRGTQPIIVNNTIRDNASPNTAAISIDANSLNAASVQDTGRQTGESGRIPGEIGNAGPLVSGNRLALNGLNGMRIRSATLTTESVWDDTDIVHVLQGDVVVPDFHSSGGLRLQSRADESLVVKLDAGSDIIADGLPLDITDRIGGSLQIVGTPGFPVVMTSLTDDSVGAGFDPFGAAQVDTNSNGLSFGSPGSWGGIQLQANSNDRNVATLLELESDNIQDTGVNDNPLESQDIGALASDIRAGDENLRLGLTVHGSVAAPNDLDVYSFVGTAGTQVWVDIDKTDSALDSVVEIIDADGNILAQSNDSLSESAAGAVSFIDSSSLPVTTVSTLEQNGFAKLNSWFGGVAEAGVQEIEPNNDNTLAQDLDGETFVLSGDPNIELSGARPYVTVGGTGDGSFDFYTFTAAAGTTGTFDIDAANFDSELFLFDAAGTLLATNDDDGDDLGSTSFLDAFLSVDFPATGSYFLAVGEFDSVVTGAPFGLAGEAPDDGDTYQLHVSIDGKAATVVPTPPQVATDFGSVNPADAGLRLVLPGAVGTQNEYFVRVRSSNVAPGEDPTLLQDSAQERNGLTKGSYQLQVRLQQENEIPGSTVRYADIRFATNGIQAIGLPAHSPLLGTSSETQSATDPLNAAGQAVNAGNIAESDRAGVSLAGELATDTDVDWFRFSVSKANFIQGGDPHVSVSLDVDYADGFGRPNTSLWVYKLNENAPGTAADDTYQLVLIGTDSDISDDRARAGQGGGDLDDFSRGSLGTKDPFIGAQELLPGDYLVAVTNNSLVANQLLQFQEANPTAQSTDTTFRIEPIDSVQLVVEDRFEGGNFATTAAPAQNVAFDANNLSTTNHVPWTLADVTTFAVQDEGQGSRLFYVNGLTGAAEARVGAGFARVHDVAMSPDGNLVGVEVNVNPFQQNDAANGAFFLIDPAGDGATANAGNTGITTFTTEQTGANAFAVRQRTQFGAQVGDGMVFEDLTFWNTGANQLTTNDMRLFGVGHRQLTREFQRAVIGPNGIIGGTSNLADPIVATNYIYRLDPATGAAINPAGAQDRQGNTATDFPGAGTNRVEFFRLVTADPQDTVTGLANFNGGLVAVSDAGEFFRMGTNGNSGGGFVAPLTTITDNGVPVQFTGLTRGPQNLENGRFANVFLASAADGSTYAIDINGQLVNVFPGGAFKVLSDTQSIGQVRGIDFSPLDVNLWHLTNNRADDPGHGRPQTHNNLRPSDQAGQNSLRFGFANADNDGALRQDGDWDPIHAGFNDTYNLPGGAHGAIESQTLDLSDYTSDDLPTLYFNYYLATQNQNSHINDGDVRMQDALRVYAAGDDGQWTLLATNNSARSGSDNNGQDEFDANVTGNADTNGRPLTTQELFDVADNGAPDSWRQARASLAAFAGQENVKLRFEFSTGASFRTGDALRGGEELNAVPGWDIALDNKSFTVATTDTAAADADQATFEFDFGLVLNLPSGASIDEGDVLTIDGNDFTFSQVNAGAGIISYLATDTPAQIATKVAASIGLPTVTNAIRGNILNVDAPEGGVYSVTGLPAETILDTPGVTAGSEAIRITQADDAVAVRDAVRAALANALNVAGQEANVDVWPVYGNTIKLYRFEATDAGPLNLVTSRIADEFGVQLNRGSFDAQAERAQQNAFEGVYLDDILVGLAERGEAVVNSPVVTAPDPDTGFFSENAEHEPSGFGINEIETGRYQLDIRTAADYGWTVAGDRLDVSNPFNPGRAFDSNARLAQGMGFQVTSSAGITDGSTFTLTDGTTVVTFEFDVTNSATDSAAGTAVGNVAIAVDASDTAEDLAKKIRDAINGPTAQSLLNVSALVQSNSDIVELHGPAALTLDGQFTLTSIPGLASFVYGAESRFGEDHGDTNRLRDQGVVLIESAFVSDSSGFGIIVDADPRAGGAPSTPGAPINYPTNNADRLAPGVVLQNNVLDSNGSGGIRISGDAFSADASGNDVIRPSTIARVVNNTIYGGDSGTGILVEEGASPTILNNILANNSTGVDVSGAATTFTLGANFYFANGAVATPASAPESFRTVSTMAPFIDPAGNNFYLVPGSDAIDSSINSLAELASLTQIKSSLGLPPSPTLAPDRDVIGQRRVDDPAVNSPAGLGSNVFKDRGAFDRADFIGLEAVLQRPLDNDSESVDIDGSTTYVQLTGAPLSFFEVLLLDPFGGSGPDTRTVVGNTLTLDSVVLTENGRRLVPDVDYVFGYNESNRTMRFTPLSGVWRSDSVYEVTLNNRDGIRLDAPDGVSTADGSSLAVTIGGNTTTFEWDSDGSVTAGSVAIPFDQSYSPYDMAVAMMSAMRGEGVPVYLQGEDAVMIPDATDIVDGAGDSQGVAIGAIRDVSGNPLQANRPTTLTQFTIVMPEVQLDFGDASGTSTTLDVNGPRHALFPIDAPRLALGSFADGDANGTPSANARGDDAESTLTDNTIPNLVLGNRGQGVLQFPAPSAALDGQQVAITSGIVTLIFELDSDASASANTIAVDISAATTADEIAVAFADVVNAKLLDGTISNVAAFANGSIVDLGVTSDAVVDVAAAPSITPVLVGTFDLVFPTTGFADGQFIELQDGQGRVVRFELNDLSAPGDTFVASESRIAVSIDLSTAAPNEIVSAFADAINQRVNAGALALGMAKASNQTLTILGDDEDGVVVGGLLNSLSQPVPMTITSTGSGILDVWIDWNQDGQFSASERIVRDMPVLQGETSILVTTPDTAAIGFTTARFRLSRSGDLLAGGVGIGGEVEDHLVEVVDGIPPIVADDNFSVNEDQVLNVDAPGVLANDTDPDSPDFMVRDEDPLTAGIQPLRDVQRGTLELSADGSFIYTPDPDFFGTDTFVYNAVDNRLTSGTPATVTLTVNPVNDQPTATDDQAAIFEDQTLVIDGSELTANDFRGVLGTPSQINELTQELTIVSAAIVSPAGLAGASVTVANNELTFIPPAHYNDQIDGPVLVEVTIQDNGQSFNTATGQLEDDFLTDVGTLTINISALNDSPLFDLPAPPVVTVTEDAGPQQLDMFASNILAAPNGASDETSGPGTSPENQTVSFTTTTSRPELFATLPTIADDGGLTFELNANVNNQAPFPPEILVEVIATDTGSGESVLRNLFDGGVAAAGSGSTYDGATLTITDADGNSIILEFDDANLPGTGSTGGVPHIAIAYDDTDTVGTIDDKILDAINNPPPANVAGGGTWGVQAFKDSVTGEIRLVGEASATADAASNVTTLTNLFTTLLAGETYDGATVTLTDVDGDAITFEFEDVTATPPSTAGITAGNSPIAYDPAFTRNELSEAISNAINSPAAGVLAGLTGTWDVTSFLPMGSDQLQLSNVNLVDIAPDVAPSVNPLASESITGVAALDARPASESVVKTFTIIVESVNDAPEFDLPTNPIELLEDAGPQSITDFVINAAAGPSDALDELASQGLTLTVAAVDPSAFTTQPSVVNFDADAGTADLEFELAPDVNNDTGNDLTILVTLMDDGGTANGGVDTTVKTLTLSVTPVNDAPSFTLAETEITVFEDNEQVTGDDPTTFAGFAVDPTQGPATAVDETELPATQQTLTFETVSVSDPSLFEVQPSISPEGDLTFKTAADQNGVAEVVVRLMDSGADDSTGNGDVNVATPDQTFTINITPVNDPPVFEIPVEVNSFEDQGLVQVADFATNLAPGPDTATDESGQQFIVSVVAADPTAFTVQPEIAADGTLTYRTGPDVNSDNADLRVFVTLSDDGTAGPLPDNNTSETKTFTILTDAINDAPTFVVDQAQVTVIEDVEDFEGTTITTVSGLISNPAPGPVTAVDELGQTLNFNVISVSNPDLFEIQPSLTPAGELSFKTALHQNGTALVVIQLVDDGVDSPLPNDNDSVLQTLTITISPINDAPEFTIPGSITVNEDAGLVSESGFATDVRRGPVGTDDENIQQISFSVVATDPSAFTTQPSIAPDGSLTFQTAPDVNSNNANLEVKVRLMDNGADAPAPNQNTSIEQTFTIIATPVNDPPIPDAFVSSTQEDVPVTIDAADVLAGDLPGPSDETGQSLIMTQIERTSAGGGTIEPVFNGNEIVSFTYTPPEDLVGDDTFLYVVTDDGTPARSGSGTIVINISGVNDAPQFVKGNDQVVNEDSDVVSIDNWATNILAGPPNALDEIASQTVSFELDVNNPELFSDQPAVSSDGTLTFKPGPDANGTAVVVVTAIDDGASDAPNVNMSAPQTFTITITPANDAPAFTAGADVSVAEDSGAFSANWASDIVPAAGILNDPATATDESSQVVDFSVTNDRPALFTVQPTVSNTGVLQFTPASDAVGSAVVTVIAVDRGPSGGVNVNTSEPQTFTITLTPVNDRPVAVSDNYETDENSTLTVGGPGLIANDTDVDLPDDTLSAVAATTTSSLGAVVVINADGSFSYDPAEVVSIQQMSNGQNVSDSFTYEVEDSEGLKSATNVTINVTGVDDPPVAVDDEYSLGVGQTRLLDVLSNDTDIDTAIDPRTITITSLPSSGSAVVNQTGVIEYTAGAGFRGVDQLGYTVRDGAGNVSNEAFVTITINNAPVAVDDSTFTFKNEAITIDVLDNDSDLDGTLDPSTVQIVASPSPSGTATIQDDGTIVFTPSAEFFGDVQFSYVVADDVGTISNVADVRVRVQRSRWQNPNGNLDVNADGFVSPIDALIVVNYLNNGNETFLPNSGVEPAPFLDPTGDENATPLDALVIINFLNSNSGGGGAEGEADLTNEAYVMMVTPEQIIETVGEQVVREIQQSLDESLLEALSDDLDQDFIGPVLPGSLVAEGEDSDDELFDSLTCENKFSSDAMDDAFDDLFGDDAEGMGPFRV